MERRAKSKKVYQSAGYVTSHAVFYGTLLFFIARVFSFFQLFVDAYNRHKLGQAPPENFTVLGVLGSFFMLLVITAAFLLLIQYRRKRLRIRRGNLYLLLNALFVVWGLIPAIRYFINMLLFFEFVYMLDVLSLAAALVVPSVLLQLSDRLQEPPHEAALLYSSIGATMLSVASALIVTLVLRKSYTSFQLVRELMFRGGIILFGVAGLQKALRLRVEPLNVYAAKPAAEKPKPVKPEKPEPKPDPSGRIECPDCGKKLKPGTQVCPRCGFDMNTPSLFDDDDERNDELLSEEAQDEPAVTEEGPTEEPAPPEPQPEPKPPVKNDICPRCGKKIPPFLSTCPHCGYFPGDPLEMPPEPETQTPWETPPPKEVAAPASEERNCLKCGRRIPGGLATCPYCGYHPADDEPTPKREQASEHVPDRPDVSCPRCGNMVAHGTQICPHCGYPFPDETTRHPRPAAPKLPRVPDPKRLTEKNSIVCPECGRRYSAARDICPYCGFNLYED
jgi:predicted amidophosphoribosyltransferase